MMTTIKNILIILLLLVIGFFIFSDPKYIGDNTPTTIITKIDTLYKIDTLTKYKKGESIPYYVLDYDIHTVEFHDTIHDTVEALKDFTAVKVYTDTFRIDTANYVSVHDTVSRNRIVGRLYGSHFTQKTIVVTNDIYHKPKNEFFVGLIGDLRRFDNKIGVGVGLNYKKPHESYTINFTTNQISLGLYKKLF